VIFSQGGGGPTPYQHPMAMYEPDYGVLQVVAHERSNQPANLIYTESPQQIQNIEKGSCFIVFSSDPCSRMEMSNNRQVDHEEPPRTASLRGCFPAPNNNMFKEEKFVYQTTTTVNKIHMVS
jgi:hypothetical protein